MQDNTARLSYSAEADVQNRVERRRRASKLRWRVRTRRPLDAYVARALWAEYLASHGGDETAALGELVAAVMSGGLSEEPRW